MPSNSIGSNVWNLVDPRPGIPVKPGYTFVTSFSFQGYNAATAYCCVKDGYGNVVFETFGKSDLTPVDSTVYSSDVFELTLEALTPGSRVVVFIE